MAVGGGKHHDGIQVAIQPCTDRFVVCSRPVLSPPRQHHGPQQQHLHARGEDRVPRLDRILAITQLMRQADLPNLGMPPLGAVEVGHPDPGPMAGQYIADNTGRTAIADHVDHHLIVLEHPVPVGAPSIRTVVSSEQTIRARRSRARMPSPHRRSLAWRGGTSHPALLR